MKLINAIGCAFNGLRFCFSMERNFRIQLFFGVMIILLGLILKIDLIEWLITGTCIIVVLTLEMINTAIEKLCDVVYPGKNNKIKIVKDVSAASVLLVSLISLVVGSVIFLPKIFLIIKYTQ